MQLRQHPVPSAHSRTRPAALPLFEALEFGEVQDDPPVAATVHGH